LVAIEAGVGLLVGVVDLGDQVPPAAPLDPPSSCWRRASSCEAACGVRGGWPWPPGRRGSWANPWLANFDLDDLVGDLRVVDPGAVDRDAFDASCFGACWACLACVGSSAPYFLEGLPSLVAPACLGYLVQDSFQESEILYFVASSVSRDFDHLESSVILWTAAAFVSWD